MLKSGHISTVLWESTENIRKQLRLVEDETSGGLQVSLTASDGNLIAASVKIDSPHYQKFQRLSAVAASIGLEYIAIEKLSGSDFGSFTFVTEVRIIRCTRILTLTEANCLFLVISVPLSVGLDELAILGISRALTDRIEADLLPSLTPVLANMHPPSVSG